MSRRGERVGKRGRKEEGDSESVEGEERGIQRREKRSEEGG